MRSKLWLVAIGLSLVASSSANAQVIGGVLAATNSHMS